jgi:hypothetical protein
MEEPFCRMVAFYVSESNNDCLTNFDLPVVWSKYQKFQHRKVIEERPFSVSTVTILAYQDMN